VREAAFIVLDEPTNCLDIDARERVEEALQAYPGALLIVSHDRTLIRAVANWLVILDPRGEPRFFAGTVAEYEEAAEQGRLRALSAEERERADERGLLELRLAEWMSRDVPDEEAQRQMLMAEMCRLRRKMEELSDQER
jgi:energy-coupling factor transporter ATP-binding protein EcfA2